MKKIVYLLLTMIMCCSVVACGEKVPELSYEEVKKGITDICVDQSTNSIDTFSIGSFVIDEWDKEKTPDGYNITAKGSYRPIKIIGRASNGELVKRDDKLWEYDIECTATWNKNESKYEFKKTKGKFEWSWKEK